MIQILAAVAMVLVAQPEMSRQTPVSDCGDEAIRVCGEGQVCYVCVQEASCGYGCKASDGTCEPAPPCGPTAEMLAASESTIDMLRRYHNDPGIELLVVPTDELWIVEKADGNLYMEGCSTVTDGVSAIDITITDEHMDHTPPRIFESFLSVNGNDKKGPQVWIRAQTNDYVWGGGVGPVDQAYFWAMLGEIGPSCELVEGETGALTSATDATEDGQVLHDAGPLETVIFDRNVPGLAYAANTVTEAPGNYEPNTTNKTADIGDLLYVLGNWGGHHPLATELGLGSVELLDVLTYYQ